MLLVRIIYFTRMVIINWIDLTLLSMAALMGFREPGFTSFFATDNNRAKTVLKCFKIGVERFGLPSRVRIDRGGENIRLCRYMLRHRGLDRNSVLSGKSTQNQRIERYWRNVSKEVVKPMKNLFLDIEKEYNIDFDHPIAIYCLHYLFLPQLQCDLEQFRQGWNNHPLRTEKGNLSPLQMLGENIGLYPEPAEINADEYGVDENYDSDDEDVEKKQVSSIACCPWSAQQLRVVKLAIRPVHQMRDLPRSRYGEYFNWCLRKMCQIIETLN